MAQLALLKQALRIDSEADQYVSIDGNSATGTITLALGGDGNWVSFDFSANVEIDYQPGEVWGGYTAHYPTASIDNVRELTITFCDADIEPGKTYQASDFDDIRGQVLQIVEQSIYDIEIEAPEHYENYADIA